MYTTAQNVRDLLGVSIDVADDSILEEFIDLAQHYVRSYIQIRVVDGNLSGNINASNTTFSTDYTFWADTSNDLRVSTLDFKVYAWKKDRTSDPFQKTELTVSTFDPIRGIIVVQSAPSETEYGRLTMDYSYYTKNINWDLLALATAWKAAELWVKREEFLVPETYVFGNKRIVQRRPWQFFENETRRVLDKIRALPMTRVAYKKLVFRPRGPDAPGVDTTAAKEITTESTYTPPEEIQDIVDNNAST